jgi:hypothetical protein
LTTETSIQPIRFDLPDVPGAVAALRLAMAQADARQNAHSFISRMLSRLEKAGVGKETRGDLHDLAEAVLLDEAMELAVFTGPRSCLSRELMCPDGDDAAAIDEIYGDGFAAALCASIPDGYPRLASTACGDGGIPARYLAPCGEWVGAFGDGQSRRLRPCAGGCGESR